MSVVPEAAASAGVATANKVAGSGYLIILLGWMTDAVTIALVGLAITFFGGVWSFVSFLQKRSDAKAKRAEEAEEHRARMNVLNMEIESHKATIRSLKESSSNG